MIPDTVNGLYEDSIRTKDQQIDCLIQQLGRAVIRYRDAEARCMLMNVEREIEPEPPWYSTREGRMEVCGWLMSLGTLGVLALAGYVIGVRF